MSPVKNSILIAGGGIGGLAAALALSKVGAKPHLLERSPLFSEVGAGIQMGPNVTRTLFSWGLERALLKFVSSPHQLQVRDTPSGASLGVLRLGQRSLETYGAPYFTIHRADLHQVLLQKVQEDGAASLSLQCEIDAVQDKGDHLEVHLQNQQIHGAECLRPEALVGADGLWSITRKNVLPSSEPRATGMVAYRALLPMQSLPERLRTRDVTVWVGPKVHAVLYPIRGGDFLNLVVILHRQCPESLEGWDHAANKRDLELAMGSAHANLMDVLGAVQDWRLWQLFDRPPVCGAHEMAKGRIALLGDAAHPMRPFLAQGAGMAIEDALQLAASWARSDLTVPVRWQLYAQTRWARNAKVQQRSIRNGEIFHMQGPMKWGRDLAMRMMGESLMDLPWLYAGP
ncbi:MAG: 3-hydroxybenzoate 6-hydroxylase 1 [Pseudomonadota bacterium]|jgi:salicylate hydroxylase